MAWDIHFHRRGRGAAQELRTGPAPELPPPGRVPHVTRLMALALRFEGLIRRGEVKDYTTLSRLGRVSRARDANHEPAALGPGHPGGAAVSAAVHGLAGHPWCWPSCSR